MKSSVYICTTINDKTKRTMNYSTITCDAFVYELAAFFKTKEEYHKLRASAYESLLRQFGFSDEQIETMIKDARNKTL